MAQSPNLTDQEAIQQRENFVRAWNETMIDIWKEHIYKLKVIDTGRLYASPMELPIRADGRFYDIDISQSFLEYGIWQDLGTGRETPIGNPGDIGRPKKREKRRWYSRKYYSSVMNLRDFYADNIGHEFLGMFANLDADVLRRHTEYYKSRVLS